VSYAFRRRMVAWEKQIEEHCVPAWRDKYVSYARLKRKLDQVVAAEAEGLDDIRNPAGLARTFTRWEEEEQFPREASERLVSASAQQRHEDFLADVCAELDHVSRWYAETVTALESRVRRLESEDLLAFGGNDRRWREGLEPPEEVAELHLEAVRLTEYVLMNAEALRKIVKKLDKHCGTKYQKDFVERHLKTSHLATPGNVSQPFNGERARACRRALEQLISPEMMETLRSRAMTSGTGAGLGKSSLRPRRVCVALALGVGAFLLARPALEEPRAQRCVALVAFIVSMWVSEAAPFEATAMLIAPLAVVLSVLAGERKVQAKKVMGVVFNDSLYVVLSGFVMSSVFSRCQLDSRAAAQLQRLFGNRPFIFMLAIMFLGTGLSALLSNVTAPLLLLEVLKPLIRDAPTDSRYSRALLLGLAFSCNIGGMATPISSPQNVAALQTLRQQGGSISWAQWLAASLPLCVLGELVAWALLLAVYSFDRSEAEAKLDAERAAMGKRKELRIPPVVFEREELTGRKAAALAAASATLGIFACEPAAVLLGGTPSVAMLFVALMLCTGIISRQTFNSYSWHLLFLIGGGNALGLAVSESGLLAVLANIARRALASSPWLLVAELVLVLVGVTTFISHTVAALVFMPLVVELGTAAGCADLAVLVGALACSAACALPMTSFPNVNSLMALDDNGKAWLSVRHFLLAGTPMTILMAMLLATVGVPLAHVALEGFDGSSNT